MLENLGVLERSWAKPVQGLVRGAHSAHEHSHEWFKMRHPLSVGVVALATGLMTGAGAHAQHIIHEGDYTLTNWTTEHGLPSNAIHGIAQTPDGYLWLATTAGLARFDGVTVENHSPRNVAELEHPEIQVVLADRGGRLWAVDALGSVVTYADGRFSRVPVANADWATGCADIVEDDEGVVYLACRSLLRCNTSACDTVSADRSFFGTLAVDRDNTLWAGAGTRPARHNRLAHRFDGNELSRLPDHPEPVSFAPAPGGRVAVHGNGSVVLHPGRQTVASTPTGWRYRDGVVDHEGNSWWVTSSGVYRLSPNDYAAGALKLDAAYRATGQTHLARAAVAGDGSVWLGSLRRGLFLLQPRTVRYLYTQQPVVPHPDGSYWMTGRHTHLSQEAFDELSGGRLPMQVMRLRDGVVVERVPGSFERPVIAAHPDGGLLIQHRFDGPAPAGSNLTQRVGFTHYRDGQLVPFPTAREVGGFGYLDVDGRGRFWVYQNPYNQVLNGKGVVALDGGGQEVLTVPDALFVGLSRAGEPWFLRGERELGLLNGDTVEWISLGKRLSINSVYEDSRGDIWAGSDGAGLLSLQGGSFEGLTTENGLPADRIGAMIEDDEGRLWFNSTTGIFVVRLGDLRRALEGSATSIPHFQVTRGGLSVNRHHRRAIRSARGHLFFSGRGRSIEVDPTAALPRAPRPVPRIQSVNSGGLRHPRASRVVLPLGERTVRIRYTAPDLILRDRLVFRHRLDGVNEDWVHDGSRRDTSYGPLPPGEQTFRVSARAPLGGWGEADAITIVVPAHYWETDWFRGLGVVFGFMVATALALVLHKLRTRSIEAKHAALAREIEERKVVEAALVRSERQVREMAGRIVTAQEDVRRRVARDLHDDVNQRLAMLAVGTGMLVKRPPVAQETMIEKLTDLKQKLVGVSEDVRAVSHRLHPAELEHLGLVQALRRRCDELKEQTDVDIQLMAPDSDLLLPWETGIGLYRIAQEALRNALKHSGARTVRVHLARTNGHARLSVEDDGRGFEVGAARDRQGLGLTGMDERVRLLGGELSIRSDPGRGTEVRVEVPVSERGDREDEPS